MKNVINLNSEQRALTTAIERIDILEERVVLLESDNEDLRRGYKELRKDNEHLRQRVDQAQEACYVTETELHSEQNKIIRLEAASILTKYADKYVTKAELKSLRDDLYATKSAALRSQSVVNNWVAFMKRVEVGN